MGPKRVAVKSLAGDSAKRRKVPDSKKKPADHSVSSGVGEEPIEESLLASDEPVSEADGDHMKNSRTCLRS